MTKTNGRLWAETVASHALVKAGEEVHPTWCNSFFFFKKEKEAKKKQKAEQEKAMRSGEVDAFEHLEVDQKRCRRCFVSMDLVKKKGEKEKKKKKKKKKSGEAGGIE